MRADPTPARRAALRILERVRQGRTFDAALDSAVAGLETRDRRLAHELAAGVLRRRRGLDERLAPLIPRGLRSVAPPTLDVLRLGAYQLEALDRVPAHAAVSTSVALARELAGDRAARFANAVLRRLQAGKSRPAPPPADPVSALARQYSHPEWLVERWVARYGLEETPGLLSWNNRIPALIVQPAREDPTTLRQRWEEQGIMVRVAPFGAGLVVETGDPASLAGYEAGAFVVQDAAQALVARYADFSPGGVVYDACAAPGGKTIALGREVRRVIAADASRTRVGRLVRNLRRAGSGREFPIVADAGAAPVRAVDGVLLDAPCLGTGTFARHPDARWRVRRAALDRLVARQADLLDRLSQVVRPGGLLVYATCSLEPEENEEQVERFLRRRPGFQREPGATVPPELLSPLGDLVILPQRHGVDGAFATRLRRAA